MINISREAFRLSAAMLGGVVIASALTVAPTPAAAQGFFQSIFGGFDRGPRYEERQYPSRREYEDRGPARAYAPNHREQRFPFPEFNARRSEPPAARAPARSATVHCVRMCDGRYFPLPRSAGGVRLDPAKVCSALCPAAATKVFNGGDMNHARASDGTRYASLDTAFAFRDRLVPDCSCTGQGPGGLAQIDVESDPTLRAGDIVVTAEGATVFRGSRQYPYQSADFTPIGDYEQLNRTLRTALADLQVNTTVAPVVPPQRIEQAQQTKPPVRAAERPARQAEDRAVDRRRAAWRQQQARERRERLVRQEQPQRSAQQNFSLFRFW